MSFLHDKGILNTYQPFKNVTVVFLSRHSKRPGTHGAEAFQFNFVHRLNSNCANKNYSNAKNAKQFSQIIKCSAMEVMKVYAFLLLNMHTSYEKSSFLKILPLQENLVFASTDLLTELVTSPDPVAAQIMQ